MISPLRHLLSNFCQNSVIDTSKFLAESIVKYHINIYQRDTFFSFHFPRSPYQNVSYIAKVNRSIKESCSFIQFTSAKKPEFIASIIGRNRREGFSFLSIINRTIDQPNSSEIRKNKDGGANGNNWRQERNSNKRVETGPRKKWAHFDNGFLHGEGKRSLRKSIGIWTSHRRWITVQSVDIHVCVRVHTNWYVSRASCFELSTAGFT